MSSYTETVSYEDQPTADNDDAVSSITAKSSHDDYYIGELMQSKEVQTDLTTQPSETLCYASEPAMLVEAAVYNAFQNLNICIQEFQRSMSDLWETAAPTDFIWISGFCCRQMVRKS